MKKYKTHYLKYVLLGLYETVHANDPWFYSDHFGFVAHGLDLSFVPFIVKYNYDYLINYVLIGIKDISDE